MENLRSNFDRFRLATSMFVTFVLAVGIGCDQSAESQKEQDRRAATQKRRELITANSAAQKSSNQLATSIRFANATADASVDFSVTNGVEHQHHAILESLGSGVGLFDFDRDGWIDVFIAGGGSYDKTPKPIGAKTGVFRNLGEWSFENVCDQAGVSSPSFYSHGVFAADINSDGFSDVVITGYRGVQLLINNGDGTFSDETVQSGLSKISWPTGAAFADVNGDGHLDLYLANYVNWSFENNPRCVRGGQVDVCPPAEFEPHSDQLFLSSGDGSFLDASDTSGLVSGGKGLGVLAADFDVDGDVDFYVANDTTANFMLTNDGDGHFEETGFVSGTAVDDTGGPNGSMGIDTADVNHDGLPDLWVANYEDESFALYQNLGQGLFQHRSRKLGVSSIGSIFVGFGTCFLDADLDGKQDIVVTNGHVMEQQINSPINQLPLFLSQQKDGSYQNVAGQIGPYFREQHLGRGLATADLDLDGDIDIVVTHTNQPVAVLRNEFLETKTQHWLQLELVGTKSNRSAIGALVEVTTAGKTQSFQVTSGASYLSTKSFVVHVGLGEDKIADFIRIKWPSGEETEIKNLAANQKYCVIEMQNTPLVIRRDLE